MKIEKQPKEVKVIFKGESWLSKYINFKHEPYHHLTEDYYQRTYDKKLSEKLFCAAVWSLSAAFCIWCWFMFGRFIVEVVL